MSGGVDSSVAAALLKRRGHDVVGVTMQIWQESQRDPRHAGCCSLGAVEDARRVARILGIPHYVLNFQETFRRAVIDEFVEEYAQGRTPNPCVSCNQKVKFSALLDKAAELGCERLATGHYARIRKRGGRYVLMRSKGGHKDQSYVLYGTTQDQLARVWFPLGELGDKAEIRRMARELGLPVADKPDSQEICFVSEAGGYREFLRKSRPDLSSEGEVVDPDGRVVARHRGIIDFTIGQRRGLGVATGAPMYVTQIDPSTRRVRIGPAPLLERKVVEIVDVTWGLLGPEAAPVRVQAKIRSNMDAKAATLWAGPTVKLVFDEPVRAVTPGQIAVAYRGHSVVAGGTIL
jgi:tRNA-specific 2-thiouridylase